MMRIAVSRFLGLKPRYVLPVIYTLLMMPAVYAAEEIAAVSTKGIPEAPVGAGQLANITLGLVLVLALIFALAWLFRRYGNVASFNRSNIHVVGGVSLGSRERAVLLDVEGEQILVGVTPNQITRLHVLKSRHVSASDTTDSEDQLIQADNIEDFASKLQAEQQYSSEAKS
ncbi:MAG: flagellar biosynthetic protein FliO [Gammaproteobacteria bacterium]|nr:flagellar biosynthetic protein FliO [Gammaproteobacteria bacterium]